MKKLITISALLLCGSLAHAAQIKVCPDCPIKSIKAGLTLVRPCDTLIIEGGTYKEGNILIEKEVVLLGVGTPVIDAENGLEAITIASNFVTIEGFQIQNVGVSHIEERAAIRVKKASHFTILNNKLVDNYFGIYLQNASNGVIKGNHIRGKIKQEATTGNGIHLWYCNEVLIDGNDLGSHRDGIYFEFVNNSTIINNHSEGNMRYGLHFMFSNDDNYRNNVFLKNGAGVAVMYSKRINMYRNTFEQNWGPAAYGLLLKEIHDSQIEGNLFKENTVGIFAETSNRVVYTGNDFIQNGWAIKISGGCQANNITQNNFLSNSFDMAVNAAGNDNLFNGNYWDDYAGYDLDRDGVGDVPHRPMKLFSYVVGNTPEAMVLLRSLFIDILNFSEKVSPVFTPEKVVDNEPRILRKMPFSDSNPAKTNESLGLHHSKSGL